MAQEYSAGIRVNAIAPGWVTVENYWKVLPGFNESDARRDASRAEGERILREVLG